MAFENLLKTGALASDPGTNRSKAIPLPKEKRRLDLQHDQLWQGIMINQGEWDYLALQIKDGHQERWTDLLRKRQELLEKNILFISNVDLENPDDTAAVNRKVDNLAKFRAELREIEAALNGQNDDLVKVWQATLARGIDVEGQKITDISQFFEVINDKIKFGGIMDRSRLSRLCGFGAQAAKLGDLITSLKAYSLAGLLPTMYNDFKKILQKAKKQKNSQFNEATDLLNKLVPFNKK
ncbi:MAG: hypothetical protein WC465_01125 [Patescibacteria group bacterium]